MYINMRVLYMEISKGIGFYLCSIFFFCYYTHSSGDIVQGDTAVGNIK